LQEELLSRRILHFAHVQLYWECLHHKKAEDGSPFDDNSEFKLAPEGRLTSRKPRFLDELPALKFTKNPTPVEIDWSSSASYCIGWDFMLENFARRHLTCSSDKLVALQGIANVVMCTTGAVFLGALKLPG
jgi:hypothetical protein